MYKKTTIVTVKVFLFCTNGVAQTKYTHSKYVLNIYFPLGKFRLRDAELFTSHLSQFRHRDTTIIRQIHTSASINWSLFFFWLNFFMRMAYHTFCCMSFSRCKTCTWLRNRKLVGWIHSVYIYSFLRKI